MSDGQLLDTIRDWLKNTDPAPDTPYYRDTRQYIMELLDAYDALARQLQEAVKQQDMAMVVLDQQQQNYEQLERQLADLRRELETTRNLLDAKHPNFTGIIEESQVLKRQLAAMTALHLDTCGDLRVAEAELAEARQRLVALKARLSWYGERKYPNCHTPGCPFSTSHCSCGYKEWLEREPLEGKDVMTEAEARLAEVVAAIAQSLEAWGRLGENISHRRVRDDLEAVLARARV